MAIGVDIDNREDLADATTCGRAELLEAALESMEQGVVVWDSTGGIIASNDRYRRMHDLPAELCTPGLPLLDPIHFIAARGDYGPGDPETLAQARWSAAAMGEAPRTSIARLNGSFIEVTGRRMPGGSFVTTFTDITAARTAEMELQKSESRHRSLCEKLVRQNAELELSRLYFDAALNSMSQGLSFFDVDRRLIVCNRPYREMYRLSPDQAKAGTPVQEILDQRIARGSFVAMTASEYLARNEAMLAATPGPTDFIDKLADGRTIAVHFQPLPSGRWVTTHEDITERLRAETALIFMARHDALTRLPNRALFQERLEQAVEMTARGARCAVLCLDLDRFKMINDTLGHPVGDGLLQAVADRLQACVREVDTVARLGGDEFAIIQPGAERRDDAALLANRIVDALAAPFDIDGRRLGIGASVGVAMAPHDGASPAALIKNADIALYLAKTEGRGAVRFFEPEMGDASKNRETGLGALP